MTKTIRIWDENGVICVVTVSQGRNWSGVGSVGGAHNSTVVDIELDPFAGLIVDHSVRRSPVNFREMEA